MGRLFSANKANLIGFRPSDADAAIKNDFPNENGIPNHSDGAPGCTGNNCPDNHDTLTGSDARGTLYTGTAQPDLHRLDDRRRQRGPAPRRTLLAADAVEHEHLHGRRRPMGGGGSSGSQRLLRPLDVVARRSRMRGRDQPDGDGRTEPEQSDGRLGRRLRRLLLLRDDAMTLASTIVDESVCRGRLCLHRPPGCGGGGDGTRARAAAGHGRAAAARRRLGKPERAVQPRARASAVSPSSSSSWREPRPYVSINGGVRNGVDPRARCGSKRARPPAAAS